MDAVEWLAKEIAGDRTLGTSSIEFDWGWYRIQCDTPNRNEGVLLKDILVKMAREYLELKRTVTP